MACLYLSPRYAAGTQSLLTAFARSGIKVLRTRGRSTGSLYDGMRLTSLRSPGQPRVGLVGFARSQAVAAAITAAVFGSADVPHGDDSPRGITVTAGRQNSPARKLLKASGSTASRHHYVLHGYSELYGIGPTIDTSKCLYEA